MVVGPVLPPHLRKKPVDSGRSAAAASTSTAPTTFTGPALPPHLQKPRDGDATEDGGSGGGIAGPMLPPHLARKRKPEDDDTGRATCGPALPSHLLQRQSSGQAQPSSGVAEQDDESDGDDVGPMLPTEQLSESQEVAMNVARIENRSKASRDKILGIGVKRQREEWMMQLPEEKKAFDMGTNRTFAKNGITGRGDSFMWTETPQEREDLEAGRKSRTQKPKPPPVSLVSEETKAQQRRMEAKIADYNREFRPKSLMDMHMDKRRKEATEATGAAAGAGERKVFSHDHMVEKRISEKSVQKMVQSSKELDSKFTTSTL